ncbi:tyrosine-type recombinase/integrase [Salinimonas sp. HHU 13199]|uniref:Tyrosine-type recombinase/integrase n=1 Tax=Salinimonas profundi TaxID=2729140 RepID=A0ABR8LL91_9ALTE|nr:tyrosine-type recombinase/integrase [Salinimonas profundi]MBD3585846.1 tyrosine-type recombinase/integrase [Salinimonas profundi]
MSHISVPYTIKRGSTYHFNLRHKSSIVRQSLHTNYRCEAIELVGKILGVIESQGSRENMDKVTLDKLVRKTIDEHLSRVGCLFGEKNSYGDMLFNNYQHESINQQFTYMYESDTSLPSYHQYKIQECFPSNSPSVLASNLCSQLFIKDDENPDRVPTPDIVDFDRNFFETEERLEVFFGQIERIKKLLNSGDFEVAEKSYQSLKTKHEKSLTFSEVSELFLTAGEEGKLPITKSYSGDPWSQSVKKDYQRCFNIMNAHFDEQMIDDINSDELDFLFRELLSNFPKGNVAPFNKMSPKELIEIAAGGQVDEDKIISGKNVFEHFKKLKTFFNFYEKKFNGSSEAIDNMRFKVKDEPIKRGRFSNNHVSKILSFVDTLNEGKKWPVNIMAFTGMRNAEVMQLRKEDILKSEEDIWYFRVTEDAGKLKTKQSNRIIPVHKKLLEKGFLDFVGKCKDEYLFRRFSTSEKYLTRLYSNSIQPKCEIPQETEKGEKLTLYSFRHFVVSTLIDKNAQAAYIQSMIGHLKSIDKSITTIHYTHTDNMQLMQEIINMISVDD